MTKKGNDSALKGPDRVGGLGNKASIFWIGILIAISPVFAFAQTVTLSWLDLADSEDGFFVERSTDGVNFSLIGESGPNEPRFVDASVELGVEYFYRVCAFNAFGCSDFSGVGSIEVGQDAEVPNELIIPESELIGNMSAAGSSEYDEEINAYLITGSGRGYETYSDDLRFTHVAVEGDFSLTLQVHTFEPDADWARVGLMLREDLSPEARHASMTINGRNYFESLVRSSKGGRVSASMEQVVRDEVYLRIQRKAGEVLLTYSHDGQDWIADSCETLTLTGRAHVGIAIGSQRDGRVSGALVEVLESSVEGFQGIEGVASLLGRPVETVIMGAMIEEGEYSYDPVSGAHRLSGSGRGHETYEDNLKFARVSLTEDASLTVKISDFQAVKSWDRAGIMIRSSDAAQAAHMTMAFNSGGFYEYLCRSNDGEGVSSTLLEPIAAEGYLRLEKSGPTVRASYSADGSKWTLAHEAQLPFGESYLIGFTVGSQADGDLTSARFEVVDESTADARKSPTILGQIATSSVIGQMDEEGSTHFDDQNGFFLIETSGVGYESYFDELRYTWVKTSGDFTLTAFVTDFVPDDRYARMGLMVRKTLDPDSPHGSILINGKDQFETLCRLKAGEGNQRATSGRALGEGYLRLQKAGDLLTLSASSDGVDWFVVDRATIAFGEQFYVGASIGSQVDGALSSGAIEFIEE
ncbi:hypothetical protein [Pelagicoccus sp. SDUM812003]|uniref:hypothetical protein n=1 Tax=Pelagicoccus sp. SDUM812003 TaxID=3041267 RepID=UPI00280DEF43|nr:hypothetical protein [Pelagicoccus sp. SDUM812003]MDQ8203388.1 hypothetical protein [Pelagicoccus sp. SDUM812003]